MLVDFHKFELEKKEELVLELLPKAMDHLCEIYEPAKDFPESDETLTSAEVISLLNHIIDIKDKNILTNHLLGRGFVFKSTGEGLFWLLKTKE